MKGLFVTVLALVLTLIAVDTQAQSTIPSITLKNIAGQTVDIADYTKNGKITVLSFWATWCKPCNLELDNISDIYEDWQDEYDVELVAITIDDARNASKIRPFVAQHGWEFDILLDPNQQTNRALNFQTIPQTFLLNKDGNIVYSHNGYRPGDEDELEEHIAELAK